MKSPVIKNTALRCSTLQERNQALKQELSQAQKGCFTLKNELLHREQQLSYLNEKLQNTSNCMMRLQEDFEHAIFQLSQQKSLGEPG